MKIGVLVAMEKEYIPLMQAGLVSKGNEIVYGLTGIGKVNAASATTRMILKDRPDCIINTGAAGGIAPDLHILDFVVADYTAHHDVWCGDDNKMGQVQGMPWKYPADPLLFRKAMEAAGSYYRPVHTGLVVTGDKFLSVKEDDAAILDIYPDAMACDMESAAVAQVCHIYNVPFLNIRIISDVATEDENRMQVYNDFWGSINGIRFNFLKLLVASL